MINHSNLTKLLLIIATLLINGCSGMMNEAGFSTDKSKEYSLDPMTNRRLPDKNPDSDPVTPSQTQKMIADNDNQNAYENYQGNVSYESIQAAKKKRRTPRMNVKELNQSMDKIGDAQEQAKSASKPEITAESNLNQIIAYNKQQKAKTAKTGSSTSQAINSKKNKSKNTKIAATKTTAATTKAEAEETKVTMPAVSSPPAANQSQDVTTKTPAVMTKEEETKLSMPLISPPPAANQSQDVAITPAVMTKEEETKLSMPPVSTPPAANPSQDNLSKDSSSSTASK